MVLKIRYDIYTLSLWIDYLSILFFGPCIYQRPHTSHIAICTPISLYTHPMHWLLFLVSALLSNLLPLPCPSIDPSPFFLVLMHDPILSSSSLSRHTHTKTRKSWKRELGLVLGQGRKELLLAPRQGKGGGDLRPMPKQDRAGFRF